MKVAIVTDDKKTIASHFGRAAGFVIYEIENTEIINEEYRPNTFTGHARGMEDAGHRLDPHGPVLAALADCDVVISHGMGRRIYNDLKSANVEVFITEETNIANALDSFIKGSLVDRPELGCDH
ncbi:iron-molybdenum cofactor biosynthesis protein [bacterium]|nr:MAG: iron-molybdenum cofactor biosynthesis protein [bacterium]